ncbi:leader peptidase (prepilin peptidase) / N-methyltransferase [Methylophilaceae bacterium]|nr:leader peptidase (prepilin peptidase) / N-methyltransferase [Methylophilaceae bacterium]
MLDFLDPALSIFRAHPGIYFAFATIIGLMIGSFLNVAIYRLPKMMEHEWIRNCRELQQDAAAGDVPPPAKYNLVVPRSACPACGHNIAAWENIPIVSYLLLRGKCSACKTPISIRYPLVEALTGLLAGVIAWQFGVTGIALAAMIFAFALVALTFIDFDTHLLPDDITLPLLWIGIIVNMNNGFTDLQSSVIGAMAGYLILWSIYWLFKIVTGKEGMGYGDFKLLAAIGAWFGWQLLPAVLLLSSIVGSVIGIGLIVLAKHGREMPIPFGPYLALGGIAALFWGTQLSRLYLA